MEPRLVAVQKNMARTVSVEVGLSRHLESMKVWLFRNMLVVTLYQLVLYMKPFVILMPVKLRCEALWQCCWFERLGYIGDRRI